MTATVLVLGGGVGGVVAATELRKSVSATTRVVLVDREPDHLFPPSLLWLITGKRTARQITRPLDRLVKRGIEVIRGSVEVIEPAARRVRIVEHGVSRDIEAEYLVVALGAELAPETIPGLAESGHNFFTLAGAESLRDALADFSGGRIVVLTAAPAYKCPAAPYEAAMLILDHCRRRGTEAAVQVDLFAAEPGPMGVTGPEVSAQVRRMVEDSGVGFHPEHQVTKVTGKTITFTNGTTADFDLLAYVPPHRAPRVVRDSGLIGDSGWVPVDRNTLLTRFPGVYAIGDVAGIPLTMGKPLPKAGVFAERQAGVVARNIAHAMSGEVAADQFDGHGKCFIEIGGGKAGFGGGNFYAEPVPLITLHRPSRRWHAAKILFEQNWLRRRI